MEKIFKRVSAAVIALAVMLTAFTLTVFVFDVPGKLNAAAAAVGVLETDGYHLDDNGKLTIASNTGMTNWKNVSRDYGARVKSIVIQSGVTSICAQAFYTCRYFTSISIPESVTEIGNYAFSGCSMLPSITIPENVTKIGNSAFYGCSMLRDINIPASVRSIGNSAFYGCSVLSSITIPERVTTIGSSAFKGCSMLQDINIPASVTSIGSSAFGGCSSLARITVDESNVSYSSESGVLFNKDKTTLVYYPGGKEDNSYQVPNNVTSIQSNAFSDCERLKSITIPNSVASIDTYAFASCSSIESVTFSEGSQLSAISATAFYNCRNLSSINIPNSVTSIDTDAFASCSSLQHIIIPYSVTTISISDKGSPFRSCSALQEIVVEAGNTAFSFEDNVLFNADKTKLICFPAGLTGSYEIPSGVTSIETGAFYDCTKLTSVTISNTVTSIGSKSFYNCTKLASVTIPSSVTSIDNYAFQGCSALTSVTIPSKVTSIGNSAFSSCSKLSEIIYPSGVTLGSNAIPKAITQVKYTETDSKRNVTEIALGTGKSSVTITDAMNIAFVAETERSKVSQEGHTHLGGTAPTCAQKSKCDICSADYGNTLEHDWGEWEITTSPTTATEGTAKRTCPNCSTTETKTLPKIDLSGSGTAPEGLKVEIKKPNLTEAGKIEYKDENGNVLATVEIPALNTAPGEGGTSVWTKAEVGEGANQSKNPTPTTGGTFVYTSTDYGTVKVEVPKLTDDAWRKTETTKPEIGKGGEYTYTSDYGTVTVDIPALTDEAWEKTETTKPEIGKGGEYTYTSAYGTVTVDVPKLTDNTWTKTETTKPSVSTGGKYTYTSDYGTVTVDIPALTDEAWEKTETTKPSINAGGKYTYTSDYGTVMVDVPVLTDEAWEKTETTKPSINAGGKYTYTSDYGTVTVDIPALTDEAWEKTETKKPSISEGGKYTYTSTDYGTVTVEVPNLSDTTVWTKTTTPATEETEGKDVYTSAYGTVEVTIPVLGHTHTFAETWSKDDAYHWHAAICGHTDQVKDKAAHVWNSGEITKDATATEPGVKTFTCTVCGATRTTEIPALGSDNSCGDNATWEYNETTKTLTITGTGDMTDWTAEDPAPWTDKAAEIEKVVIDDGITSIGDNAFEDCTSLTDVTIPESVENIGDNAFAGCTDLKTVTFEGKNPPAVGNDVFKDCTIDKIVVPEGAENAYKGESGFTDLTDKITAETDDNPGSDNSCGDNATWKYDETTKTLTITGTGDMTDWTAEDPAPWTDKAAEIEKVVIDDGITSIGDNAFEDCTSLTGVTIPEGVENIGDNAFAGCTDLETVTFEGKNPPAVGNDVFKDCTIDKIVVPEGAEDAYKGESGFTDLTDKITAETGDTPGSDNSCGDNATWKYDETTKTLTITGTGDMTDWTAEDPAPWADKAAEIEKVVIDDGITSIGDNAFEGCTGLTGVTIPESVENIGDNAFEGCTDLETVTFEGKNPPAVGNDVFKDCTIDKIVVPEGAEDAYKGESGFTDLTDKITDNNDDNDSSDNSCGDNATWKYDETTKTLTITGTGDMTDWTAEDPAPWADKAAEIEKVIIDGGITSIGDNAFEGCTGLTGVTIPESVENIGDNAFAGCTDLETVTFEGENPPTMGSDVFKDCTVDKIVVPEGAEDAYKGESGFTDLIDKITAETGDTPGSDDSNTDEPENPGDDDDNNDSSDSDNSGNSSGDSSNSSNSGDTGNNSSDNENISKDVQLGENVPKTEFATPTEELISSVLDPEEITQIKSSDEVSIVLEISDTVSNEDKQKVESVLEANAELQFAQYMDIALYKVINDIKTQVTTTNKPIRITFEVPANLRKSGRTFEVCRVHNGETVLLPDLDDDENTVTIETDRFSTYALVYRDKASASESGNPSTGIAVSLIPLVTAAAALIIVINRKKK